jgi:two-component system, NarL family, nitrate/nitrite sensor histidine kinase NarX
MVLNETSDRFLHTDEGSEAEILRKSLDTLLLISEVTSEQLFTDQIFKQVMDALLLVTGFQSVYFRLHDKQAHCLRAVAGKGLPTELMADFICFPDDQGIPGIAFQTGHPVYTSNLSSDNRRTINPTLATEWESLVAVPLLAGIEAIGTMQLASPEAHAWSQTELRWLAAVGKQIGLIVHHAQLVERLRDQSVLQERTRLGREIHDGLAQVAGTLALQIKVSLDSLETEGIEPARSKLREAGQTAQILYDEVRGTLFDLRAVITPDAGFLKTFRAYLKEYQLRSGIQAHLIVEDEQLLELPATVLIQLTRILQESLVNVRKHAQARHVWVSFERDAGQTRITLMDDGIGFGPDLQSGQTNAGFGLQIMRERAESIGGSIQFETQAGGGAQVVILLPCVQTGD